MDTNHLLCAVETGSAEGHWSTVEWKFTVDVEWKVQTVKFRNTHVFWLYLSSFSPYNCLIVWKYFSIWQKLIKPTFFKMKNWFLQWSASERLRFREFSKQQSVAGNCVALIQKKRLKSPGTLWCRPQILSTMESSKQQDREVGGAKIITKSRGNLQIRGTRRVTWCKVHTEGPQTLGDIVENLLARVSRRLGFLQPCFVTWVTWDEDRQTWSFVLIHWCSAESLREKIEMDKYLGLTSFLYKTSQFPTPSVRSCKRKAMLRLYGRSVPTTAEHSW
jgi:hypothetical protein